MNSLSWLIYLISMLDTLRGFLVTGLAITVAITAISAIARFGCDDEKSDSKHLVPLAIKCRNRFGVAAVFFAIMISIVPSKNTMVLIAASEIGEHVVNSETGREIANEVRSVVTPSTELLRTWIEDQTRQIRAAAPRTN